MAVYQTRPFMRGDVYYISYNNAFGSEQGVGRPGLIVCSDEQCQKSNTLLVAFLTTSDTHTYLPIIVELNSLRKKSYVKCANIAEVDKARCKDYYGTLTPAEMAQVDEALACVFNIPFGVEKDTSESDALKAENASLEEKLLKKEQEKFDVAVERDFYKKLYESALNRFIGDRLERDIAKKSEPVEKTEVVEKPTVTVEEARVDLNSCSASDLKKLGLKDDVILRIIQTRPFKKAEDLRQVQGVTRIAWQLLQHKVEVVPVPEKKPEPVEVKPEPVVHEIPAEPVQQKVSVNTATALEIAEALGIHKTTAYLITGYRNKHGLFASVDDLKNVPRLSQAFVDKHREKLCV